MTLCEILAHDVPKSWCLTCLSIHAEASLTHTLSGDRAKAWCLPTHARASLTRSRGQAKSWCLLIHAQLSASLTREGIISPRRRLCPHRRPRLRPRRRPRRRRRHTRLFTGTCSGSYGARGTGTPRTTSLRPRSGAHSRQVRCLLVDQVPIIGGACAHCRGFRCPL